MVAVFDSELEQFNFIRCTINTQSADTASRPIETMQKQKARKQLFGNSFSSCLQVLSIEYIFRTTLPEMK